MDRLYKKQVEEYLTNYGKLVFISGARQVGKNKRRVVFISKSCLI
ncbi:MAG: hypothetical protein O7C59_01600 [Rickettsia endosymbiont of Ixodes persulcatus]|nr:hypothetical protein [Rickettsia endosymbiont of Ixodes persulcatus]